MPPQFHQPSGRSGSLRLSTTTVSWLTLPGAQAASVHVERGVRVRVAADAAAVQEHGGLAADALEADPPAEPPRRLGPGELDPVAAHAAGVERGERARVEHARHLRGPPGRVHARGAAGRRVGGGGRLALRRGLLRRGRLRRGGRGGVGAHLPSRRERHARRRRRGRGRGGHAGGGDGQTDVKAAHQPVRVGETGAGFDRVPPMLSPMAVAEALEAPMAVFGVLLMLGALVAGLARRSFLSLTAAFVVAGFVLGQGGLEVLDFDRPLGVRRDARGGRADPDPLPRRARGGGGDAPARLAPAAPEAGAGDAAHLRRSWRVATHTLTDLGWTESFLVGALLSPTDPVLSSTVVTNPRVPRLIRHSLNLESGPQRRACAAGRARVHRGGRERRRLRLVAVRAPGREPSA